MSDKGNSTIFFVLFSLCIVLFHVNSFASVDITGPRISSVMMRTETVTIGDTITVEATVDDESGIKFGSVQLLNRSLGNTSNAARKHTYFESVGGNRWVATFIVDEDWAKVNTLCMKSISRT